MEKASGCDGRISNENSVSPVVSPSRFVIVVGATVVSGDNSTLDGEVYESRRPLSSLSFSARSFSAWVIIELIDIPLPSIDPEGRRPSRPGTASLFFLDSRGFFCVEPREGCELRGADRLESNGTISPVLGPGRNRFAG